MREQTGNHASAGRRWNRLRLMAGAVAIGLIGLAAWMFTRASPGPVTAIAGPVAKAEGTSEGKAGGTSEGVTEGVVPAASTARDAAPVMTPLPLPRASTGPLVREEAIGRPTPDGMRCRVVFEGTGEPVPRAEVFVANERSPVGLSAHAFWTDPEAYGWRYDADQEGVVQLPSISAWREVLARSGARSGATRLYLGVKTTGADPSAELTIAEDETLRVIVDIDGGVPDGVVVAFCVDHQWLSLGRPAADASVELRKVQVIRRSRLLQGSSRIDSGGAGPRSFGSALSAKTMPVPRLQLRRGARIVWRGPIASGDLRRGGYVFRVPRLTDLHLQALAPDGAAIPARSYFRLWGEGWSEVSESVDGVCVLPSFAVGDRIWATAVPEDRSFAPSTEKEITIAAGADGVCSAMLHYHQPGPRREVSSEQEPVFRVRLVDEEGSPIGPTTLSWMPGGRFGLRLAAMRNASIPGAVGEAVLDRPDESWTEPLRCDDAGVAWVPIRRELLMQVTWEEMFGIPDAESPTSMVTLRYHGPVLPGTTDLGDVTVISWREIVTGTVVDPGGRPIAGATVSVIDLSVRSSLWWSAPTDPFSTMALTDANGGFSLHRLGSPDEPGIRVRASLADPQGSEWTRANCAILVTTAGCTDARVVLRPAQTLRGSLALPDGVRGEQFRIRVRPSWPGELPEVAADGTFTLTTDRDPVSVIVGLKSETDSFLVLPGVAPEDADPQGWHPAITAIELSAALRTARVRLVDEDGAPVAGYPIVVRGTTKALLEADQAGELVVAFGEHPARIDLNPKPRGRRRMVSVDRDLEIVVERPASPEATQLDR